MKLTILIVACMAIVAVQSASVQNNLKDDQMSMFEKQRFIYEMVLRVENDLLFDEWIKLGGKLVTDQSMYTKYGEYMVKFEQFYKIGDLLPRGEFFGYMQRIHALQANGLFGFFYYANDWKTLVQNIVWARLNVNEGMFIWALTLTAIHREDMKGIILPQIYEIFPQMFLGSKYILAAEKFDWDVFNREIMLEKEMKSIYEQNYPSQYFGDKFYLKDWKMWQWWKLMGLDDGWQLEEKSMLRDNVESLQSDPMFSSIYKNLKMAYIPVDYTRDYEIFNEDSILSYFTEDLGWNSYWYYLNMDYALSLNGKEFNLDKDRRGEWWIYNVQQLLARYYMERLSQGLGEFETLSWYGLIKTGYDPQLIAYNGKGFTFRKNYWEVQSYQNLELLNKIINLERRIDDFISSGKYVMNDGKVDLNLAQSAEYIGNLLNGNVDIMDFNYFGYWWFYASKFLGGSEYHDYSISPSVFQNPETMLRDPLAYELFKVIVGKYYQFKYQLPPYTQEELLLPGVKVEDVEVSQLMTYFDLYDIDMTTLLNDKMIFQDGKYVWNKALFGRQARLNHKPFNFTLQIMSEKSLDVVVRVFLGPLFDKYGQKLSMITDRENFMELDEFISKLEPGKNMIFRKSEDFDWTYDDPLTYSELYNYLMLSYEGKYEYKQNISQPHSLFPDRLILPHGWVKGMPMALFFMVSPYSAEYQQYATYDPSYLSGIGSGFRHIDSMPFGYPLDRKIENLYSFFVPNMFYKSVKIYHEDKYDKYYPIKYENYGSFDYNY